MEVIYTSKDQFWDRTTKVTTSEMINQYGSGFQTLPVDDQIRAMWLEAARRSFLAFNSKKRPQDIKAEFTDKINELLNAKS